MASKVFLAQGMTVVIATSFHSKLGFGCFKYFGYFAKCPDGNKVHNILLIVLFSTCLHYYCFLNLKSNHQTFCTTTL